MQRSFTARLAGPIGRTLWEPADSVGDEHSRPDESQTGCSEQSRAGAGADRSFRLACESGCGCEIQRARDDEACALNPSSSTLYERTDRVAPNVIAIPARAERGEGGHEQRTRDDPAGEKSVPDAPAASSGVTGADRAGSGLTNVDVGAAAANDHAEDADLPSGGPPPSLSPALPAGRGHRNPSGSCLDGAASRSGGALATIRSVASTRAESGSLRAGSETGAPGAIQQCRSTYIDRARLPLRNELSARALAFGGLPRERQAVVMIAGPSACWLARCPVAGKQRCG